MAAFIEVSPTLDNFWRSVILFGRNVAAYKFALAHSLLELAAEGKAAVTLGELAVPFTAHVCRHLALSDRQATSRSSRFLDACREFNAGGLTHEALIDATARLGFGNVIDAFHVVNQGEVGVRFFADARSGPARGLRLTDELFRLREQFQGRNLPQEVEARWRLVETAWDLGLSRDVVAVGYDPDRGVLTVPDRRFGRKAVTSCRDALNGYQKGRCFFCFADIAVRGGPADAAEVDHFFPHCLKRFAAGVNLDGVWNLVLACPACNRGVEGKSARVPALELLGRLGRRNEFLIESHHPLRETLVAQTGATKPARREFLQGIYRTAKSLLIHTWRPGREHGPAF